MSRSTVIPIFLGTLALLPAAAQQRLTAADYARAQRWMPSNTSPLVLHSGVRPNWLAGDRFWYRTNTADGNEFIMVDPAHATRLPAFDHTRLASALSAAAGSTYTAAKLPFTEIDLAPDGTAVTFSVSGKRWTCETRGDQCTPATGEGRPPTGPRNEILSPG